MLRAMLCEKGGRRRTESRAASLILLLTLTMWLLPQTTGRRPEAAAASPGYVLMIHATVEPHSHPALEEAKTGNERLDQTRSGFSIAKGALMATRNDDSIIFHAIPYRADTVYPVVVAEPRLEIKAVGSDRRLTLEPNRPAGGKICHIETTWADHEGPLDACTVYRVPVASLAGMSLVTLALHFTDATGPQQKVHNAMAHGMLHMAIGGMPIDLRAVDASMTEPTPHFIQSLIETRSM